MARALVGAFGPILEYGHRPGWAASPLEKKIQGLSAERARLMAELANQVAVKKGESEGVVLDMSPAADSSPSEQAQTGDNVSPPPTGVLAVHSEVDVQLPEVRVPAMAGS
jgi:hypothetical protein